MKQENYIVLGEILFLLFLSVQSDQLSTFNEQFISTYDRARNHLVSTLDPLIICNGDNAVIIHRQQRYEEQIIPKLYHDLKAISHIPFKIYLTIMFDDEHLSENNSNELKQYLHEIHALRNSIEFPADILQNQYDIIDLSVEYLREILKTKFINQTELKVFCRQARSLFSKNIDLAARGELEMIDAKIKPWYEGRFNDTERARLKIVLTGPKTARYGYLAKSYFYALIDERREGNRIIFAENVDLEEKALEVLGVWHLDAKAGQMFFNGDGERLHRDLLADAANAHIQHLFTKSKNEL